MAWDNGYRYENHSDLYRAVKAHYRARGVTSERKLDDLCFRWKRTKGYRFPVTVR